MITDEDEVNLWIKLKMKEGVLKRRKAKKYITLAKSMATLAIAEEHCRIKQECPDACCEKCSALKQSYVRSTTGYYCAYHSEWNDTQPVQFNDFCFGFNPALRPLPE